MLDDVLDGKESFLAYKNKHFRWSQNFGRKKLNLFQFLFLEKNNLEIIILKISIDKDGF